MIGGYDDPKYRINSTLSFPATGSLAGTAAAAADLTRKKRATPTRIVDAVGVYIAGGTDADILAVTINTSLAGTGDLVPIGTMIIGTQATLDTVDIAVTETTLLVGDDIVLSRAIGTSAIIANVQIDLTVREGFSA